jgi:hypothetical protein
MTEKKQQLIKTRKESKQLYTEEQLEKAMEHVAMLMTVGIKVSPFSFLEVQKVLEHRGLSGVPFIDTKTFKGWQAVGRKVKKGEKAIYQSISWNRIENIKEHADGSIETTDEFSGGKVYSVFHVSQTEEVKQKKETN